MLENDGDNNAVKSLIELHIGNLSNKTQPNNLYDFFTGLYGKGSVLVCHIPTHHETGSSRGFGIVTMLDSHAKTALEPGRKHELDGRILKVTDINFAGSVKGMKQNRCALPAPSSGCHNCGYLPRQCTGNPNIPINMNMGMGPPPLDIWPGPYVGPPPKHGGRDTPRKSKHQPLGDISNFNAQTERKLKWTTSTPSDSTPQTVKSVTQTMGNAMDMQLHVDGESMATKRDRHMGAASGNDISVLSKEPATNHAKATIIKNNLEGAERRTQSAAEKL